MVRNISVTLASGLVAMVLAVAPRTAAIAADNAACINEIAANSHKVSSAEDKALADCSKLFTKGLTSNILSCAQPFASDKVKSAQQKAQEKVNQACGGVPPSFGPASLPVAWTVPVGNAADLFKDIFGNTPNSTTLTDSAGAKCQANVRKAVTGCTETRLKEFDACLKDGFKAGAIDADADIEACLGDDDQPDPKGKIAKACEAGIADKALPGCTKIGVNLDRAVAGCASNDPAAIAACIAVAERCRICERTNGIFGTAKDCDAYDDGDDRNSSCTEPLLCGDGNTDGDEICDDGNNVDGDGCSANCQFEAGWDCGFGGGSAGGAFTTNCEPVRGDGLLVAGEECDDQNLANGDGCSAAGTPESGYLCGGQPSVCVDQCGTGRLQVPQEQCDDGNLVPYDGCNSTCGIEAGWTCSGAPSVCTTWGIAIDSPAPGTFNPATTQTVTGHLVGGINPGRVSVELNGVIIGVNGDGTFSAPVATGGLTPFFGIDARATDKIDGSVRQDRSTVVTGSSVADGDYSPRSIALRINDTGLNRIEPFLTDLVGGDLDLATLIPVGTRVLDNVCVQDSFAGCLARATVTVVSPAPSLNSFGIDIDSQTNYARALVTLTGVRLNVQITGTLSCPAVITAAAVYLDGNYVLDPDPADPTYLDVNLSGSTAVNFSGFNNDFTCGGLTEFILNLAVGNVQDQVRNALVDFLKDPDGSGPQDAVIAEAVEQALRGLTIASAIGDSIGVKFEAPFTAAIEDTAGITFESKARIYQQTGTGPGECVPPAGAPSFARSLTVGGTFPTYGAAAPNGTAYDIGVGLSADAFNQLLKSQVECGFLNLELTNLDLGTGGIELNAGTLGLIIPEFAPLPAETPIKILISPIISPVVTGEAGPNGETTSLRISHVLVQIIANDLTQRVLLSATFDATVGLNLAFLPGEVSIQLGEVDPSAIDVHILKNTVGVDVAVFENELLPQIVQLLLPQLAGDLTAFDLPVFLGFQLNGVQITNTNKFFQIFTNLSLP